MRKTILWMVLIALAAMTARAERPVDETRSASPSGSISIELVAGSVTVVGTDVAELRVTGSLGDDVEELDFDEDSDGWSIEVKIPDDHGKRRRERDIAADLEVQVPRGSRLDIEGVSASVAVSGVSGEIDAASVSGAVSVSGGSREVEAESVSGAVTVTDVDGSVAAESVSGQVELQNVAGEIEASTVSGNIRIAAGSVSDVEIETVAGEVHFQGSPSSGSVDIETHSGNVEALLPAALGASFELESFSGSIDNGFGPQAQRSDRYEPGTSVEFTTGSGGVDVTIETFSGNITLKSF